MCHFKVVAYIFKLFLFLIDIYKHNPTHKFNIAYLITKKAIIK